MRDDRERLRDILGAIARIERYTVRGRQAVEQDELIQTWIVYHLQLIGEASRTLSVDLRSQHPDVSWSEIVGLRNVLVHQYFGIDVDIIWLIVEQDLPDLKRRVEVILQELGDR